MDTLLRIRALRWGRLIAAGSTLTAARATLTAAMSVPTAPLSAVPRT